MSNSQLIILLVILIVVYLLLEEKSYPTLPFPPAPPKDEAYWKRQLPSQKPEQEIAQQKAQKEKLIREWTNIHPSFANPQLIQAWRTRGHNHFSVAPWIDWGVKPFEAKLVAWIHNVKSGNLDKSKLNNYEHNELEWVISYYGSNSLPSLRKEWLSSGSIEYQHQL